ncbi:MAG: acyltransferase [Acidimicrobiia bacterium]|nr:acyltransferase [Acidimicrobiia bacterium]
MPGLDGLRGLAVLGVLLFHAGYLGGGFLGVDLFFALSGFLITSLLLGEHRNSGSVGLGGFWARRVRRLLPAILFLLAGVALYAVLFAEAEELNRLRAEALATLGYVANWNTIFDGQSYWELFQGPSPLEHTWSLAIEEQFYLIWPLAFAGLFAWKRGSPKVLFGICVSFALAAAAWMWFLYTPGGPTQRVYVGTDTRAISLLAGGALASLIAWRGEVRSSLGRWGLEAAAILSVVGLTWAWIVADGQADDLYRGGFLLHALALVVLIAAVAHSTRGPVARALSFKPFVWIGLISYGLYLWHWPVYVVLDQQRTGLDGWVLTVLRITVSIAIATVSYFLIEMPIRRGALSGWRIQTVMPAAAVVVAALLVVTTAGGKTPTQLAFDSTAASAAEQAGDSAPPPPAATAADEPRILVVGDSVAWFLGFALEDRSDDLGVVGYNRALPGCVFASGATRMRTQQLDRSQLVEPAEDCSATWADDVAAFQPDAVLVVLGGAPRSDVEVDGAWLDPCSAEYASWYRSAFPLAVATLGANGAVVAVAIVPEWGQAGFEGRETFTSHRDIVNERIRCVNELNADLTRADPDLAGVDLSAFVCPRGECHEEINGVLLREDGVHLEGPAAVLANEWFVPQLVELIPAEPPPPAETNL